MNARRTSLKPSQSETTRKGSIQSSIQASTEFVGCGSAGRRFYGQLRMVGADGSSKPRRISLGVVSLDVARAELERIRTENRQGALTLPGRQPTFRGVR